MQFIILNSIIQLNSLIHFYLDHVVVKSANIQPFNIILLIRGFSGEFSNVVPASSSEFGGFLTILSATVFGVCFFSSKFSMQLYGRNIVTFRKGIAKAETSTVHSVLIYMEKQSQTPNLRKSCISWLLVVIHP